MPLQRHQGGLADTELWVPLMLGCQLHVIEAEVYCINGDSGEGVSDRVVFPRNVAKGAVEFSNG